jgi:hypothetical protein
MKLPIRITFWLLFLGLITWLFLIQRFVSTSGGHQIDVGVKVLDAKTKKPIERAKIGVFLRSGTEQFKAETPSDGTVQVPIYAGGSVYWSQSYLTGTNRWNFAGKVNIEAVLKIQAPGYRQYETNFANVFGSIVTWKGTPRPTLEHTVLMQPLK